MLDSHDEVKQDLELATAGDGEAMGRLLRAHRERLKRLVSLRLDRRLQGRIDPSDVIQEAFLEAATRFREFVARPAPTFYIWLRFLTMQKLAALHRHHLAYGMRSAHRERSVVPQAASSMATGVEFVAAATPPSGVAARTELIDQVQRVLRSLDESDREILMLRHFEQLTNREAAHLLGIRENTATKRYGRALSRLKDHAFAFGWLEPSGR